MKIDNLTANLKLQALLKERKPDITESSVKTYASSLKSLFYRHNPKDEPLNFEWFANSEVILADIKNRPLSTHRSHLSAIMAIAPVTQVYSEYLSIAHQQQKEIDDAQEMTEKQEENWEPFNEIKATFKKLQEESKPLLKSKKLLDKTQFEKCLNYLLLSLTTGIFVKPRRSLDWTEMKVKNYDPETDNYVDFENRRFVFNKYKTAKDYGAQTIDIPSKLMKVVRRWSRHTDQEYLLTTFAKTRISTSRLTQLMNKIFGKNISTSMLRHIFLSDVYKDAPSINEMQTTATEMGHTPAQALQYVKKSKSTK